MASRARLELVKDFVRAWNEQSIEAAAAMADVSRRVAICWATRLRKRGFNLKRYPAGFAAMSPEQLREIGRRAPMKFTRERAMELGRMHPRRAFTDADREKAVEMRRELRGTVAAVHGGAESMHVRLHRSERRIMQEAADAAGMRLGTWMRVVALAAAEGDSYSAAKGL